MAVCRRQERAPGGPGRRPSPQAAGISGGALWGEAGGTSPEVAALGEAAWWDLGGARPPHGPAYEP